jgi:hypothetical protein
MVLFCFAFFFFSFWGSYFSSCTCVQKFVLRMMGSLYLLGVIVRAITFLLIKHVPVRFSAVN